MSRAYDFLKECGVFFLLTINGDYPAGRVFGAVMEVGEHLYISTNDFNQAHKQLRANGHVQIVARKDNSREWIRITGVATECNDIELKQKMYEENPVLRRHHSSAEAEHFLMFQIVVENVEIK